MKIGDKVRVIAMPEMVGNLETIYTTGAAAIRLDATIGNYKAGTLARLNAGEYELVPKGAAAPRTIGKASAGTIPHQDILNAMETYGGSFVKALAEAWRRTDLSNTARLIAAFPDYYQQYAEMAKQDAARKAPAGTSWPQDNAG